MAAQIYSYFVTVAIQAGMPNFFLIYTFIEEYTSNVAAWMGLFLSIVVSMLCMSIYNRLQ